MPVISEPTARTSGVGVGPCGARRARRCPCRDGACKNQTRFPAPRCCVSQYLHLPHQIPISSVTRYTSIDASVLSLPASLTHLVSFFVLVQACSILLSLKKDMLSYMSYSPKSFLISLSQFLSGQSMYLYVNAKVAQLFFLSESTIDCRMPNKK
jgi:hypothetical protein